VTESARVDRLQELLDRVERLRAELEGAESPERAVEVLASLNDAAREVQAEIERMRREGPDAVA
jgi:hypothetical protein